MRLPSPRVLIGSGLVLLAAVLIAFGVRELRGGKEAAPPATSTATTTAPAPTQTAPPVPPGASTTQNGIAIENARVTATPFSATVEWTTQPATHGRVSAALGGLAPTLWSADTAGVTHRATIGGLAFGSGYSLTVSATTADGRRAELALTVETPKPDAARVVATTRGTSILLDGEPFFPLMIWGQCPGAYDDLLAAGMNLIADNPCGGVQEQLDALAGSALSASVAGDADADNPNVIGWFYPDEPEGHGLTAATLPAVPSSRATGRISLVTLTNHFYSLTAPLPAGRGIYPALVAKADVVGFDLYPLQVMCWPDRIGSVYDAQRELVQLASGKPTFQWIEVQTMQCPATGPTEVTPATVRAESWLAVAAGATGLGFFPGDWTGVVGDAVRGVTTTVRALQPALLAPPLTVDAGRSALRVAARELNGAVYVIAANPTGAAATATVRIPGLGDRTLVPVAGGESLAAKDGAARIALPPLGTGVWVAPPAGA